jgi:putative DNA primase/helicase
MNWIDENDPEAKPRQGPIPNGRDEAFDLVTRRLSQFERRPIERVWPGRVARGKLTLIAGHPGLGKSQIALSVAATISTSGYWPDGGRPAQQSNIIILSAEDEPEDTLGPRFDAAGGDSDRVEIVEMVRTREGARKTVERGFSLQQDISLRARKIEQIGNVALIVVDPITAYLGDDIDSHKTADVRAVLRPLVELAGKYHAALLGITHLRKNADGDVVLLGRDHQDRYQGRRLRLGHHPPRRKGSWHHRRQDRWPRRSLAMALALIPAQ